LLQGRRFVYEIARRKPSNNRCSKGSEAIDFIRVLPDMNDCQIAPKKAKMQAIEADVPPLVLS
jgi:hypothetical protein